MCIIDLNSYHFFSPILHYFGALKPGYELIWVVCVSVKVTAICNFGFVNFPLWYMDSYTIVDHANPHHTNPYHPYRSLKFILWKNETHETI